MKAVGKQDPDIMKNRETLVYNNSEVQGKET